MIKYDVPLNLKKNANMQDLVAKIKPYSTILEFGPSTGRLTRYLKETLKCNIYIVEIDSEAFEKCMNFAVDGICGDIEEYKWKNKFKGIVFDYAIFADVLEHLRNPKSVIVELKDLLNNEAKVLVSVPNITHNAIVLQLLNQRFDYQQTGLLDNTHIHFFTIETCREMFEESGYYTSDCIGTFAEPYDMELKMTYNNIPQSVSDYLASRDYGNLYQIIYEFSLNKVEFNFNDISLQKHREYFCKVFYDFGTGFSEENSELICLINDSFEQHLDISFNQLQYVKSIAFIPLDNFWSKSKIEKMSIDNNLFDFKYIFDDFTIQNESGYNIIYKQKYIFDINLKIKNFALFFKVKKILADEVFAYYNKETQTLNHFNNLQEIELTETRNEIVNASEISLKVNHQFIDLISKNEENKQIKLFKSKIFNKIYDFMQRKDHIYKYDIKIFNYKTFQNIEKCVNNSIYSTVQNFDVLFTADYAILVFNDAILSHSFFDCISNYLGKNLIFYSDSLRKCSNLPWYNTDFSIDYVLNNDCEFDVIVVQSELLKLVNNFVDLSLLHTSREAMIAFSSFTNKISHISKVLYSSNFIAKENTLSFDNHICGNILDLFHKNGVYYKNKEIRYDNLQNKPLVSIIIPTKDHIELLENCINSILSISTYENYEIIILNNNSIEQKSLDWFKNVSSKNNNVKVIEASFDFNWSRLNNFGIRNSDGMVYIFLNNDTVVKSPDWIERLSENALREDVGVVGALLLYEDETIQHAGVVVGMTDFADHIYKFEKENYASKIFPSPKEKRNVLAVTGACMAISKNSIDKIGLFNEEFIICGSDVEMCIRAYKNNLVNVFEPKVELYHLESKSRDNYIPEIDFIMSEKLYEPYRSQGDPFFNINLNRKKTTPEGEN